jgi:hypothetical protein
MEKPRMVPAEAAVFAKRDLRLDELTGLVDEVIHRTHICMRENSTQGTTTLAQGSDDVVVPEVKQRRYTSKPSDASRSKRDKVRPLFRASPIQRARVAELRRSRWFRLTKSTWNSRRTVASMFLGAAIS